MTKASDSDHKADASKEAASVKAGQTMSNSAKKKQVSENAKGSADKAAKKTPAGKDTVIAKVEQVHSGSEVKKSAAEKSRRPVQKSADNSDKTKGAFAHKMDEVKIAIASSLHAMRKGIHWAAKNIAEKTKE